MKKSKSYWNRKAWVVQCRQLKSLYKLSKEHFRHINYICSEETVRYLSELYLLSQGRIKEDLKTVLNQNYLSLVGLSFDLNILVALTMSQEQPCFLRFRTWVIYAVWSCLTAHEVEMIMKQNYPSFEMSVLHDKMRETGELGTIKHVTSNWVNTHTDIQGNLV